MTIAETTTILRYISAAYPAYKPQYDQDIIEDVIKLWASTFVDVPGELVLATVKSYVSSGHVYAPNVGQIKEMIMNLIDPNAMNEEQAWDMVRKAAENGLYGSEKEYEKLPEIIKKTIRSPHYIYTLAMCNAESLTVEKSHFLRSYREEVQKQKDYDNLPKDILPLVQQMRDNVPQVENKQQVALLESKKNYEGVFESAKQKFLENKGNESGEADSENGGMSQWIKDRLRKMDTNETVIAEPEAELGGFA